ncbi:MAG: hypothetical protein UU08_C0032G0004 [Candidatus Uhrbacteria bacterium GW2011_GWE2_40_58]|nr:MAG: hypothetical protein UT94_C0053G0004 [Candidatus Uhrbacteria bacterium GW2011_GWF2_40_263]KKR66842.1 MAG: hypothetical protein UU08_C0032G0004 [Candidatus Uhrbacteria bacterium GW2011_GWE2_40_58]OGL93398.1 MAG: hypothetical protein A2239_01800 [Candidatus Uhrbacteria bacterium RIFOXYA2_FULL_40_9]OGL97341.1 MAG: hypothetical protein A2332_01295 [Candidatus Uhrbacteria bacterium RIFOXYB2_FULL_41_18]HCB56147.1 hypothetical protein [Candidatus Uhrbacteria bacterium]
MIEIEKKFRLTPEVEKSLLKTATFLHTFINHDIYFDNQTYDLTRHGIWFRKRNEQFELKMPLHQIGQKNVVTQYEELETEDAIRLALKLNPNLSFEEALKEKKYFSFASYTNTRQRYKDGPFSLDFESCDFGDGDPYRLVEIELIVSEAEKEQGVQKIIAYAQSKKMELVDINGKLPMYLKRHDPKHYQVLKNAGIVYEENA